ncbi:MAG: hypothetical protein JWP01_1664, partial [Myxococcales bacterium]|nr:hypothetical protein [Myxococcales bacterium]
DVGAVEHVGKTSEADRHNRYAIARGEAMECGAIIDVVRLVGAVPESDLSAGSSSWSAWSEC